jgi:hypothetical protein
VALAYAIWRVAKRPLRPNELYTKRLMSLYSVLVACFIGVFVCVSIPHATLRAELGSNPAYTVYAVAAFGLLMGFNTMITLQHWSRVWYKNGSYVLPHTVVANHQEPLLNPETVEVNSHVEIKGKSLENMFGNYTSAMDTQNDLFRRRIVSCILYVVICYLTVMDGFFIVYWANKSLAQGNGWLMIAMAWIVRFAYSAIICGILIHSMFHALSGSLWKRVLLGYPAMCALYFVVLVLSALPILLNVSIDEATRIIQQIPFTLFYGIASGVLLWFLGYFVWIQDPAPTRGSTSRHLLLIWIITLSIGITGLFI